MSWTLLLVLLSPFFLLVSVFGLVVVVALVHARPEDVPTVLQHCTAVFRQLADRLPEVHTTKSFPSVTNLKDDEANPLEEGR